MSSSHSAIAHETGDSEHWLSPAEFLAQLDVRPGMTVGEIGAGKGLYTLSITRRIGPAGRVFAVEWRPWLIDDLRARVTGPGSPVNITFVPGRPAETDLPTACCDLVIFADIWHQLEHPDAALDEVRRILRPGGRLAIFNWRPGGLYPPGPPNEHRVSLRATLCAVEMKSWSLIHSADFAPDGYLLVFETTDESVQS